MSKFIKLDEDEDKDEIKEEIEDDDADSIACVTCEEISIHSDKYYDKIRDALKVEEVIKITEIKLNSVITERQIATNIIHDEIIEMMKKYKRKIKSKFSKQLNIWALKELIKEVAQQGKTSLNLKLLDIPKNDYFLKKYNNCNKGVFTIIKEFFVGVDKVNTEKNVKSAIKKVFNTISIDAAVKVEMVYSKNAFNVMKYKFEESTDLHPYTHSHHPEYLNLGILLAYNELKSKWCKKIFDDVLEGFNVRFIACDFIPTLVVCISWEKLHDDVDDSCIYHHDKMNIWLYD